SGHSVARGFSGCFLELRIAGNIDFGSRRCSSRHDLERAARLVTILEHGYLPGTKWCPRRRRRRHFGWHLVNRNGHRGWRYRIRVFSPRDRQLIIGNGRGVRLRAGRDLSTGSRLVSVEVRKRMRWVGREQIAESGCRSHVVRNFYRSLRYGGHDSGFRMFRYLVRGARASRALDQRWRGCLADALFEFLHDRQKVAGLERLYDHTV